MSPSLVYLWVWRVSEVLRDEGGLVWEAEADLIWVKDRSCRFEY